MLTCHQSDTKWQTFGDFQSHQYIFIPENVFEIHICKWPLEVASRRVKWPDDPVCLGILPSRAAYTYTHIYIYIYIIIYVLGMGSHLGWSVNSLRLGDIYASVNWVTIDSGNGMAPLGTMPLTEPLMTYYCMGTTSSEIGINILQFSVKKMYLKMLSAKRQPFCSSLNM